MNSLFKEIRLAFREKPGRSREYELQSSEYEDLAGYEFSDKETDRAYKAIKGAAEKHGGPNKEITVKLEGKVGNRKLRMLSPKKVDLEQVNRKDFLFALRDLEGKGDLQKVLKDVEKETYDLFVNILSGRTQIRRPLEAVWLLNVAQQERIMKCALAYLCAYNMQQSLKEKFKGRKDIKFDQIKLRWDKENPISPKTSVELGIRKKKAPAKSILPKTVPSKRSKPRIKLTPEKDRKKFERTRQVEQKETAEWNKHIIPTFDDGPVVDAKGNVDDVTLDILGESLKKGANNVEFYWCGANLLSTEAKKKMGIKTKTDVPRATTVKPGEWRKWILKNKPAGMTEDDFFQTLINPQVRDLCFQIAKMVHASDLPKIIGFHGMTHESSKSSKHLMKLTPAQLKDEIWFFEKLMQAAFAYPGYKVEKARTPYGSGLEFDIKNPAQRYERYNKNLRRGAPGVEWHAWHADTEDWTNDGDFKVAQVAEKAIKQKSTKDHGRRRVLMHERYYADSTKPLRDLYETTDSKHSEFLRSQKEIDPLWELGKWQPERVNKMLTQAQRISDPNERMEFIMGQFKGTKFHYESQLKIPERGQLRVRLESFDCITFVYYMLALHQSHNFNEFVENLAKIRYHNPEKGGVDNDTQDGNIYDFAYNAMCENAGKRGMVKDVTEEVAGRHAKTITTVLKPIARDKKHDKKRKTVTPKINNREKITTKIIPQEKFKQVDLSGIKTGDIILFTRGSGGKTIIAHGAIAYREGNEVYIYHATSSGNKKVELRKERIQSYVSRISTFKGFKVLRPQTPQPKYTGADLDINF
jgi:hypothetical protein